MNIPGNPTITLSTGRSRKETAWKKQTLQWEQLAEKLSVTRRTAETVAEYFAAPKSRQDDIKDVGGFVGGTLDGGRRKAGTVLDRCLVTLDVDQASAELWDDFTLQYDNAALVYSTHKHTPEQPRLRLVLPLARPVTAEEYVPIARRIAGVLGITQFDDTTYEPERLMYWPSSPRDGEYYFRRQDGPWLDPDQVLATYADWRDASSWPVSDRQVERLGHTVRRQADPLEKPGIVGAFCRTYGIGEAIAKYLPDVYEPSSMPGRYTYRPGSTAAGMIVYDDKFAYSHHGTDPAGSQLCNAFDLVRIHRYAADDSTAKPATPPNRLPSFLAMESLAAADPAVRKTLASEKLLSAGDDFAGLLSDEASAAWLEQLETDKRGGYLSTLSNIRLILENDPNLAGQVRRDEFHHMDVIAGAVPWRRPKDAYDRFWKNADDACLRCYLEADPWRINGVQKIYDALESVLEMHKFHPIRDYIASLAWDGAPRLDTLFIDYLGAPDTTLTRAMTRKAFAAAVARVMHPGTKFDYVVVLIGAQGTGKSSILRKMGREWFSDSFTKVDGKEAMEQLQGAWIMEIGELAGLKKAEVESIKGFISKEVDTFRVAYGRKNEKFPRQTVFFGTTNEENFLRDTTGNRRFWPIVTDPELATRNIWKDLTPGEVDQLWAEAAVRYHEGEPLYLPTLMETEARVLQAAHAESDDRRGIIEEFLRIPLPRGWDALSMAERRNYILTQDDTSPAGSMPRERVCAVEVLNECFGERLDERTKYKTREINIILKSLPDWKPGTKAMMGPYGQQRFFKRLKPQDKDNRLFG